MALGCRRRCRWCYRFSRETPSLLLVAARQGRASALRIAAGACPVKIVEVCQNHACVSVQHVRINFEHGVFSNREPHQNFILTCYAPFTAPIFSISCKKQFVHDVRALACIFAGTRTRMSCMTGKKWLLQMIRFYLFVIVLLQTPLDQLSVLVYLRL